MVYFDSKGEKKGGRLKRGKGNLGVLEKGGKGMDSQVLGKLLSPD